MTFRSLMAIIAVALLPQVAGAHGFTLTLVGNKIIAVNNDGFPEPHLFAHDLNVTNNVLATYESNHGAVDANDAGSGFYFEPSDGNPATVEDQDSFTYHIQSLWKYEGGAASLADPGTILELKKASNGALLSHIDGQTETPASFGILASTSHELIWAVPQSSPVDVIGLVFTIRGTSFQTGLPFIESDPLVVVQWLPTYVGDPAAAYDAIFAAATAAPVPEPTSIAAFAIGAVVLGVGLRRSRRSK